VFIVVSIYFVIDSVPELFDTPSTWMLWRRVCLILYFLQGCTL